MNNEVTALQSSNAIPSNFVDSAIVATVNVALVLLIVSFVLYLLIPRGARRYCCNAHQKRFARSKHIQQHVSEPLITKKIVSYETFDDSEKYVGFVSPSARSIDQYACTFQIPPAPLILDCERPGVTSGDIGSSIHSETVNSYSVLTYPSRTMISDKQCTISNRLHFQTPLPHKIEEDASLSANSTLDGSVSVSKKLLILISSRCLDKQQAVDQRDALTLLKKRNVAFDILDGMKSINRNRREKLYSISGNRALYPQFFLVYDDGRTSYLGDWKMLQKIHLAEGLPRQFHTANPDVSTWNEVFADTSQIFSV